MSEENLKAFKYYGRDFDLSLEFDLSCLYDLIDRSSQKQSNSIAKNLSAHISRNTRQSPESKKIEEALEYINSGIARSQNELTVKRLCKLKSILEAK